MENLKKVKIPLFFLFSYIIFIPMINGYLKVLEKCFQMDLNVVDMNLLNFILILFKNSTICMIWVIFNLIIILAFKCIVITKKNSKIEIEGVNLKKKDRNIWNSRLGNKRRNRRIFKHR